MALEHQDGVSGARVPELDSTVLGTGHDEVAIGSEGNGENKVLGVFVSTSKNNKKNQTQPQKTRKSLTLWPTNVRVQVAALMLDPSLVRSHILIVLSRLPDTRWLPSGENATL